ncbi:type II secretion system minor pseudopilin GspK [Endozoicomonas sp. 8E]|uniref:type II secretion system minor pseudopilin GspK n=1 Tax=Endozoicomonas sp. 8E TaxID=3035692 RepID=UPI002939217A|nr:type II secretion system minor pseudopilin GspK [Endozoicomonas sp. 8E]WOG29855.1 type II secretion system minor pseudopilin GspK [Endozoicomonas sp. 8E]
MRPVNRQRGIALIYVLLIFAMITLMASQMTTSLWLHTEKNTHYLERIQARHLALGAEHYVALLLEQDAEEDKKKKKIMDHESERWNIQEVGYAVDQGDIELVIVDETSRFNLNWLAADALDGQKFRGMFENILKNLGLNVQIASAIKDWIDHDQEPSEDGGEDNNYLSMDPPRRTSDAPFVSLSELRLIQGVGIDEFELLAPLVTALPDTTRINVNTVLPEVMRSLSDKLTDSDVATIIDARSAEGFVRLEDLARLPALKDKTAALKEVPLDVASQYFTAYIKATYRDTSFYLKTLMYRNTEGQVQIAGREIGPNDYWVIAKKES